MVTGDDFEAEQFSDEEVMGDDTDTYEDDAVIDEKMFEPIYKDATITVCGAYCAIMEFKRSCRLPFTTIPMLLQLLQMICPGENSLPKSVYMFKKFFREQSSSYKRHQFCANCGDIWKIKKLVGIKHVLLTSPTL